MKAILLSIKPEWLVKILNNEKTIEVRKNKALANAIRELIKQYGKALIYMYCSKDNKFPLVLSSDGESFQEYCNAKYYPPFIRGDVLNGKVVARFWCDKVVEYVNGLNWEYVQHDAASYDDFESILEPSCLTEDELRSYVDDLSFSAIHISKLEIFDRPRELVEFKRYGGLHFAFKNADNWLVDDNWNNIVYLTKAPQNYCYVEGEVQ